jgi:hypothetical protein
MAVGDTMLNGCLTKDKQRFPWFVSGWVTIWVIACRLFPASSRLGDGNTI